MDEAENMNKNDYDSCIKDFKETGVDLDLIRKVIFQKDQNPTEEALKEALKQYYLSDEAGKESLKPYIVSELQDPYTTKLSVVLYELKEKNSEKFDFFCRSFL